MMKKDKKIESPIMINIDSTNSQSSIELPITTKANASSSVIEKPIYL